jgi:hypothetical protein
VEELKGQAGAGDLRQQLLGMALKQARGLARYSFDEPARTFHELLYLDGRVHDKTVASCFRTEEERAEAARHDPSLAAVTVYRGLGIYEGSPYWSPCMSSGVPYAIAFAAHHTGDDELRDRACYFAEIIMEEAAKLRCAFNRENRWTFPATASYIQTMLMLFETTGRHQYLEWARRLADMELGHLSAVKYPHWWRLRESTRLLEALVDLADTLRSTS